MTWLLIMIACTDEGSEGPKDRPDRSNADTDDTGTVDTSDFVFYEDFQDSPEDLEHRYEGLVYYDSVDDFTSSGSSGLWFRGEGMVFTTHSVGYAVAVAGAIDHEVYEYGDSIDASADFRPDVTFDLTTCTTGELTFTWGVDDLSLTGERAVTASVVQSGMGRDDAYPCDGTQNLTADENDNSASWGPYEVTCSLDYDCGYEPEGTFQIYVFVEVICMNWDDCEEEDAFDLGALAWVDNIGVNLE